MNSPLLTDTQLKRYSRQLNLKELGVEGQRRLLDAKVLCIGAGALGSPAALYLAAAGVGTIGIVDGDTVELSNLHRQILHSRHDIGKAKGQSARDRLAAANPDVTVHLYEQFLRSDNAREILSGYDVVINGSDNFPTRYLVNDACFMEAIPLVDASILRWEAQCTVFLPGHGCYRCLFPEPPPPGAVPNCAEAGVTGALAGHMGTRQALESIKLILGIGESLANRLLIFDALAGEYREISWQRNADCPVCGDAPSITELIDYEQFCGITAGTTAGAGASDGRRTASRPAAASGTQTTGTAAASGTQGLALDAEQAAHKLENAGVQWLDVRDRREYEAAHIPGIRLIPRQEIGDHLGDLDPDRETIVVCHSGVRSAEVTLYLREAGFRQARNLSGGMVSWINARYPVERGDT